jgi:hypothetical protein
MQPKPAAPGKATGWAYTPLYINAVIASNTIVAFIVFF